ncbi:MAG TPA: DUF4340 domain-containing protein [Acidobacteriaceae bacterium]|nr:DUF4340 domain-containing protein [Acidobacteriaceae bacterium]
MKFRGLIAAVVVLAGLGGWLWWSQKHPAKPATEQPATAAITKVDAHAVTSVTVTSKGAQPITVVPSASDAWKITAPAAYRADADTVNAIVHSLSDLHPESVVDEHAVNLAPYGLSDPAVSVKVDERNNQSASLSIGDKTPTGGAYYAMIPGTARVYTVDTSVESSLAKSLNDLRDKHLLPLQAAAVNSLEITGKGNDIAIARKPGGWQIQKPQPFRTDNYAVDDLVQQLTSATFDPATNPADAAASFAKAAPVATVKLTSASGTDTLEVRKSKTDDYAKSSATQGVWKLDASLAGTLYRGVDAYRNKQLFDFGFTDPNRIDYHARATSVSLERKGTDWYSNGQKMDADSASAVVEAVRGLSASKFVDSGYSKPEIDLTIVSNDGKDTATAHFQTTPDGAIAKRDDSPGLYFFDSTTMKSMETAMSGLKPAAPATKKK